MVQLILTWKAELGGLAGNCTGSPEADFCMLLPAKCLKSRQDLCSTCARGRV